MTYKIEFEKHPEFIWATITGENSAYAVASYLDAVIEESQKQDCYRVLLDERLEGPRLEAEDVFRIVSDSAMRSFGIMQAVAYVDANMGEMAHFAETLAQNRGMPVRTFATAAEAEAWLQGIDESDEQDIFRDQDSGNRNDQ